MAITTLIPYGQRANIWRVQADLGIDPKRLLHVRQTVDNYLSLQRGEKVHFWNAILPENRAFENRRAYLDLMSWIVDQHGSLGEEQQRDLEAGIRLHDIGYARSPGGDHPQRGYELLHDKEILKMLDLPSCYDYGTISAVAGYHGLFSDVGYLYKPDLISSFSPPQQISIAIMSALDSTAKPLKEGGFHSMLFSHLLHRYQKLLTDPSLTAEERIQQLLGPMNYVWLEDSDAQEVNARVKEEGLKEMKGFNILISQTIFHCWPLLKDLITPTVEFAASFYTPVEPAHISHLVAFLRVMSQVLESADPEGDVIVETGFNYFDFASRPPYLAALRKDLTDPEARLERTGEGTFVFGRQEIRTGSGKIILSSNPALF